MKLLDGKSLSNKLNHEYIERVNNLKRKNIIPCLVVILIGDNEQSKIYINMKRKRCEKLNIIFRLLNLDTSSSTETVVENIYKLNNDSLVHGILVQLPLPNTVDKDLVLESITPSKDVDGFNYNNFGKLALNLTNKFFVPCTPLGCIKLLDEYDIDLLGKNVVVVGKSNIVGLPLSLLLMHREATVTVCHINTENLENKTREADIIFVGCGVPNLITKDHIKKDAIIVDIGINKIRAGGKTKIVGDVDFEECSKKASYITPVPGGIGPMTISMLIGNLLDSCESF